jgi:hypothetical protein
MNVIKKALKLYKNREEWVKLENGNGCDYHGSFYKKYVDLYKSLIKRKGIDNISAP